LGALKPPRIVEGGAAGGRSSESIRLEVLGSLELHVGGRRERLPTHAQRLLAFLAVQRRSLHRAYVAGRLWPSSTQERAFGALRTTLWRVRRLPTPILEVSAAQVALAPGVVVDLGELEDAVSRVLGHAALPTSGDVDLLVHARPLLPDWYEDWAADAREEIGQRRLVALETASSRLVGTSRQAEAATAALAAVAADPLRESARRALITSQLGEGNLAEAARQYASFCSRLGREMGLEPSPRIRDLARMFDVSPG
jgi:DNA-binding SARP family transcriptional activator